MCTRLRFTSTLSSNTVERIPRWDGGGRSTWQYPPATVRDAVGAEALKFVADVPTAFRSRSMPSNWTSFVSYRRIRRDGAGMSVRMYTIGDDLSWTHGKHAFKGGFELRNTNPTASAIPLSRRWPRSARAAIRSADSTARRFTGLTANAATAARSLLTDLTGSIATSQPGFRSGERHRTRRWPVPRPSEQVLPNAPERDERVFQGRLEVPSRPDAESRHALGVLRPAV